MCWCAVKKLLSSVTVKWLAVKTVSEMTYTVSGGVLNSTQTNPIKKQLTHWLTVDTCFMVQANPGLRWQPAIAKRASTATGCYNHCVMD